MDDRNAQVGWTEAQWNRVREAVLREWQRVRVAGSFLPTYTSLPPSSQVVPSEAIDEGGKINDSDTIRIVELSASVDLSRQQILEDDISDALLLLGRAAIALARVEDEVIFKGQSEALNPSNPLTTVTKDEVRFNRKRFPDVTMDDGEPRTSGNTALAIGANASARGLVVAAPKPSPKDNIVKSFTTALGELDDAGYGKPYVGILGQEGYAAAHDPIKDSLVLPADRIEPMLGQKLVRATVLAEDAKHGSGLVISLAGDAVDLVLPVSATPSFTHINDRGRYVFRVYERFALRIKDPTAIRQIQFELPK